MQSRPTMRFAILLASLSLAAAFVPLLSTTTNNNEYKSTTSLSALNLQIPPPPPPNNDMDFVQALLKNVQAQIPIFESSNLENALKNIQSALPKDVFGGSSTAATNSFSLQDIPPQVLSELKSTVKQLERTLSESGVLQKTFSFGSSNNNNNAIQAFLKSHPQLEKIIDTVVLTPLANSPAWLQFMGSAFLTYYITSSILQSNNQSAPKQPYPLLKYDPNTARAYFDQRFHLVVIRGLQVLTQSLKFGIGVLRDKLDDKIELNEFQRGQELAQLLTRLGPTFIKVGQSLSIRTDLLSPGYLRGLEALQDQVPPFDAKTAQDIIEREWGGQPLSAIIDTTSLPEKPIAAASLGQVYKARLRSTGEYVAIKVQRPDISTQIALDMHLLREIAPIVKQIFNMNSDTVGTVDAWGRGFVDELDYLQEALNAETFSRGIVNTPLRDVVFAPKVIPEYSTRSVLVSEWIDGERLDRSASSDVTVLCSIAMNTYLTMLLELGMLHCDPHPGNLLRTPDGRLCILDWGMVTRIDSSLQLTLVEHMAHLTSADYGEIPRDLLLLDFIPKEKAHLIEDSGVVEILTDVYGAWTQGGGAAAINVNDIIARLQDLTQKKGNLFQIPPYFAYIAKSFSVLEGIGLSNDPKYSIIKECLPYISKRLITDKERMGPALSTFIFGPAKSDRDRIVDYKRVKQLIEGFADYTTSTSTATPKENNLTKTEQLEESAEQIFDLIFSKEETPLQSIVLEQLAKIVSSSSRSVLTTLRERSGVLPSGRTLLGTFLDPLGLFRTSPLVTMSDSDQRIVETTQKLYDLLQQQSSRKGSPIAEVTSLSREDSLQLQQILVRKLWQRRESIAETSNRFTRILLEITADKLERGERTTLVLPERHASSSSSSIQPTATHNARLQSQFIASRTYKKKDSRRLNEARKRLSDLEIDHDAAVMPEVVPGETVTVTAREAVPVNTNVV